MDNEVIRSHLLYARERLQDERGSDFSGVEALRLAILKFVPDDFTVLDNNDNCMRCGAKLYLIDIDNGNYRYCPNCGYRIIRRDLIII